MLEKVQQILANKTQCRISITSGTDLYIKKLYEKYLGSKMWIEKINSLTTLPSGKVVLPKAKRYCFCVSSKNFNKFKRLVYPYIQIKHKKRILNNLSIPMP